MGTRVFGGCSLMVKASACGTEDWGFDPPYLPKAERENMEREQNITKYFDVSSAYKYLRFYGENPSPEIVTDCIVAGLKQEPDENYGDVFNKLVCTNLDEELTTRVDGRDASSGELLEIIAQELRDELVNMGKRPNLLKWSEERVRE